MRTSVSIGTLALASLLVLAAAPAEAQTTEYDWAYLFAGQTQLLEVDVGPNAVLVTLRDVTVSGALAADARAAIDSLNGVGDGNGELTQSEVVGFESLAAATINGLLPTHFEFDLMTIDGKTAFVANPETDQKVELTMLDVKGAEGPVTSTEPITTDLAAKLRFDSVDLTKGTHSVRFENVYGDFTGLDMSDAPPAEIKVRGYKSWAIDGASVQPAMFQDRLAEDTLTFTNADVAHFDQTGEGLAFDIKGDPSVKVTEAKRDSPGIGPLAFVAALGIALAVLRRRF